MIAWRVPAAAGWWQLAQDAESGREESLCWGVAPQMMAAQMIVAATDRSNVVRDNNLLEKLPIHLMAIGARWRSMPLVVLANGV